MEIFVKKISIQGGHLLYYIQKGEEYIAEMYMRVARHCWRLYYAVQHNNVFKISCKLQGAGK